MENTVKTDTNPLEAIRSLMIEMLEKSQKATQSYIDQIDKTTRSFPGAGGNRVDTFWAYIEERVAANHAFVDKLLCAKNFHEAWRIQAEYFQSQLKAAADNATKLGAESSEPLKRSAG